MQPCIKRESHFLISPRTHARDRIVFSLGYERTSIIPSPHRSCIMHGTLKGMSLSDPLSTTERESGYVFVVLLPLTFVHSSWMNVSSSISPVALGAKEFFFLQRVSDIARLRLLSSRQKEVICHRDRSLPTHVKAKINGEREGTSFLASNGSFIRPLSISRGRGKNRSENILRGYQWKTSRKWGQNTLFWWTTIENSFRVEKKIATQNRFERLSLGKKKVSVLFTLKE